MGSTVTLCVSDGGYKGHRYIPPAEVQPSPSPALSSFPVTVASCVQHTTHPRILYSTCDILDYMLGLASFLPSICTAPSGVPVKQPSIGTLCGRSRSEHR